MKKSVKCLHRQIVFTIPKELRSLFFIKFETCINILFYAVNLTKQSLANTSYKKKNKKISKCRKKAYKAKIHATPAFFAFLHSFGRSLIFNPHIHILIAEMKFLENGNVQTWKYFNYSSLSKRYQYILLDLLEKEFGPKFKPMKTKLYKDHPKGFYVYAEPKKFSSFQAGVEYIARYCGRTPISENRIKFYDGENVTFWYDDHATGEHIELTVSAEEFILMLVRHIIPEQTKIIRYYGAYNKKHKALNKVKKLISDVVAKIRYNKLKHRKAIK